MAIKNFSLPGKLRKRGFIQISFAWLFAIIVGAIIIVFAILAATKVINLGQYQTSSESQAQFGVLLNPLQTSFESASVTSMAAPSETRIYNSCSKSGTFGKQTISIAEKSFNKWPLVPPDGTSFQSKYLFSENVTEGKQFFLFSKPFEFPFKVADLIYVTSSSENYCFIDPPSDVNQELSNLNEKNIFINSSSSNCPAGSIRVCFDSSSSCDINVDTFSDTVKKDGLTSSYYGNALMYAAIFSDHAIYECQLSRLMKREYQLSNLYFEKQKTISLEGCSSNLRSDLSGLGGLLSSFSDSSSINGLISKVNALQSENSYADCPLW